jgi:hypothetical protein
LAAPVFDPAVIEGLQAEMDGEADALPLLAFVLQRLMREHAGATVIGLEQLNKSGGLAEAIESEAEGHSRTPAIRPIGPTGARYCAACSCRALPASTATARRRSVGWRDKATCRAIYCRSRARSPRAGCWWCGR